MSDETSNAVERPKIEIREGKSQEYTGVVDEFFIIEEARIATYDYIYENSDCPSRESNPRSPNLRIGALTSGLLRHGQDSQKFSHILNWPPFSIL